jgi:PIN domain nuclease of toxin-antitoxin system
LKLLLDTHFLVWLTVGGGSLSEAERTFLSQPNLEIVCSTVSLWELRLKWDRMTFSGDRKGPVSPAEVRSVAEKAGWAFLPVLPRHTLVVLDPPVQNRDPFDEMLLLQAQAEGLRLLSRDGKLRRHPLTLG